MKRWLSLLLLLGALFGLLGQEAAFAHVMPVQKTERPAATVQMSPECAEMMGLAKQEQHPDKPCEGMTPDCMAKMGCAVPLALLPAFPIGMLAPFRAAVPQHIQVAPLIGRDTGPEPEPPSFLG